MPTNRRRRTRKIIKSILTDSLRQYLEMGDYCGKGLPLDSPGRIQTFMLAHPSKRPQLKETWLRHRAEILQQWKAEKRPGLPWAEKEFGKEIQSAHAVSI
ncbi:MAG: hypothetical protein A2W27_11010 [Deltaproteobacteria bacterium RBG_16_44_11]|nr:MAG: hypothetical protein A2W27_11010 [Deltaproteobacteria bacterium RBG_16_44_11]